MAVRYKKKNPSSMMKGSIKKGSDTNAVTALHRLKTRKPVSFETGFPLKKAATYSPT